MKDTISLTIPMDYNALTRASDMLHGMAVDLQKDGDTVPFTLEEAEQMVRDNCDVTNNSHIEREIPVSQGGTKLDEIEPSATTVFGGNSGASLGTDSTELNVSETATPAPVDLDSAGLPWDHRINGKARLKLQKTGTWKYIRGIDPALIDQVEAELRVTMAIPATTPAAPATAPIVETEVTPAPPATDMTFPILMSRITAGKITEADVIAACNKQGIPALPLLAARPDLVPAIAAELGITA